MFYFAPVGHGIYGNFIRQQLQVHHKHSLLDPVDVDNDCCYCLVEPSGELTFLSYHGSEYQFHSTIFSKLELYLINTIYICGLELKEETGIHNLNCIKQSPFHIYFAPGPRLSCISTMLLEELWKLHPVLHLNQEEFLDFKNQTNIQIAMKALYRCTQNIIIVTCGNQGSYLYDGNHYIHHIAPKVKVIDTIGAGHAHIAAIECGYSNSNALFLANQIVSIVVQTPGFTITKDIVSNIRKIHYDSIKAPVTESIT